MIFTKFIVAFSSAIGFVLQLTLALIAVRYFSPNTVGELIVISQIGFLLASISLAQAQIGLLANQTNSLAIDTKHAFLSSLRRFVFFSPSCIVVVWASNLPIISTTSWSLFLAITLMTWLIAQSMSLRVSNLFIQSGVRFIPQLFSLLFLILIIYYEINGPTLLEAAFIGYLVGASWILPVVLITNSKYDFCSNEQGFSAEELQDKKNAADDRSTALRVAHSFGDVVLATTILVVWQRLYGAQETGWLAAPLRVIGFVPAIINIAWAQISMARPHIDSDNSFVVGIVGFASVSLLGMCSSLILSYGLLGDQWHGISSYLIPLILWQGSACLVSAYAHIPFRSGKSTEYSRLSILVIFIQFIGLISPFLIPFTLTINEHIYFFSILSFIGYTLLFLRIKVYY